MLKIRDIFFTIVACLILTACSENTSEIFEGEQSERPKIALIMKSLANEFFVSMAEGAENHQSNNSEKYELIVNGIRNETDLTQQVQLVDQMISVGVDAIVIAPADSKALVPVLAKARNAGIMVVNIDNRLDGMVLKDYEIEVPFIGPDNLLGAKMVGDYLAQNLAADAKVAILEGVQTAINSQQRTEGFNRAMSENGIEVVTQQSADWDQTKAVGIVSGILVQYPDINAILCANDSMALGAIAAINQAGKAEQVTVVGFDNISAANALIKSGDLLATADQYGSQLAVFGIDYALELLDTGIVPEDRSTDVDLITIETIQD